MGRRNRSGGSFSRTASRPVPRNGSASGKANSLQNQQPNPQIIQSGAPSGLSGLFSSFVTTAAGVAVVSLQRLNLL